MSTEFLVNGEFVRLARLTRGMTQKQLSGGLGIYGTTLSRIESGSMSPNDDILGKLADALDYPVSFFFQNAMLRGSGTDGVFHRKRQRLPSRKLSQVYAMGETRRLELEKLSEWNGVKCSILEYPIDFYDDDPEKIARTVRASLNLPAGPVFNLTKTLEDAGCVIVSHDFGTRQIDGFSVKTPTTSPIFHMNRDLPPDRWRWTLAHELGHVVMCQDLTQPPKIIENQADLFAGEFLAPGNEIMPFLGSLTLPKLAGLKLEWKISMQALVMRASHFGTITPSQKQSLFIQMSKGGYRIREPETLDPPREYPSKLFQLAKTYMTEVGYSRKELMEFLALNERDFNAYYHDPQDGDGTVSNGLADEGDEWSLKGLTP